MNAQNTANALTSDNLQDTLLAIRSRIFSVQAQNIEETVEGKSTINSEYKEYDIGRKYHESYAGHYEVEQEGVNVMIAGGRDLQTAKGLYKHTRTGNTMTFVPIDSTKFCMGVNTVFRIGILSTLSASRSLLAVGANLKVTGLSLSSYVINKVNSFGACTGVIGVMKTSFKIKAPLSERAVRYLKKDKSTLSRYVGVTREGVMQTHRGTKMQLYS